NQEPEQEDEDDQKPRPVEERLQRSDSLPHPLLCLQVAKVGVGYHEGDEGDGDHRGEVLCGGDEKAGEGGETMFGIDVEAPARRYDYLADASQPQSREERSVLPTQLLGGVNERNDDGHENEEG